MKVVQKWLCVRYLSTEGDCTRLAFGADACWPWRVVQTVLSDLAPDVFQVQELASISSTG